MEQKARAGSRNEMFWRIIWPVVVVIIFGGAMLFANGCGGGGGGSDGTKAENSDLNQNNNQNPPADQNANPPADVKKIAGLIQLSRTGQAKCYNSSGAETDCKETGQDGDIQAGIAWPDPRFTDNGDGAVTDNLTGLMWMRDGNIKETRPHSTCIFGCPPEGSELYNGAASYVLMLNAEKYLGYSDWRLPNINELGSLLDLGKYGFTLPQDHYFVNIEKGFYWSSTIHSPFPLDEPPNVWGMYFYSGIVSRIETRYGDRGFIWPVRTTDAKLVRISQTDGDDPKFKNGIVWPNPRFIDNGNGTLSDALTGLVWTKNMNPVKKAITWQEALDYVAGMNKGAYPNFGYVDWRLPNRKELESLQHYHTPRPWAASTILFTDYPGKSFWTSTTHMGNMQYAWSVVITSGTITDSTFELNEKAKVASYLWPVR